jgi:hypothetical protein
MILTITATVLMITANFALGCMLGEAWFGDDK